MDRDRDSKDNDEEFVAGVDANQSEDGHPEDDRDTNTEGVEHGDFNDDATGDGHSEDAIDSNSGGEEDDDVNDDCGELYEEDAEVDDMEYRDHHGVGVLSVENPITINGLLDIYSLDLEDLTDDDLQRLLFVDLEVAHLFYSTYGKYNGFSVRKSNVVKNKLGEIVQQTFLCSRAGLKKGTGLTVETRKRKSKNETRCECNAMCRVHVDVRIGRWYVSVFEFNHNHEMLKEKYFGMLPGHRKMSATDIMQADNFRKVGIRTPHIYAAFANSSGGYEKVGYMIKDIYNQSGRQRRQQQSDVKGALKYLKGLCSKDPLMYVTYSVDAENRLQHLFWSDGESQMNYQIFGDVLAFDATYKKNMYLCPFVVFLGVNNHNQTIVFAAALVTNETEETYVWLLQQFAEAMKGKAPSAVITDGDVAMKNAIRRVFPNVHHRLCAWHLLRNAVSNLHNNEIMPYLKKCMLGDIDVTEFEEIWSRMVNKFNLQDNNWLKELYQKRKMWSAAHIRGNFFGGIRTTSRCEAFHSHLGKFVHSKITLTDFVEQFHRCVTYFRFRELEADFRSDYGNYALETNFRAIERHASRLFTKELFLIFVSYLKRTSMFQVVDCQEMSMYSVFTVEKYRTGATWLVSYCPSVVEFRCSCLRMESIGLPCAHILCLMLCLHFTDLPKSVILDRWTKGAKDAIEGTFTPGSTFWDSRLIARYAKLVYLSRELCQYAYTDDEDYDSLVVLLTGEISRLKLKKSSTILVNENDTEAGFEDEEILDPPVVRHKGCGSRDNNQSGTRRRQQNCSRCGQVGHNKRSCTRGSQVGAVGNTGNTERDESVLVTDTEGDYNSQVFNDDPRTFVGSTSQPLGD